MPRNGALSQLAVALFVWRNSGSRDWLEQAPLSASREDESQSRIARTRPHRPLQQRARPLADPLARRPKALLAGQREDRDRQAEPLVQLVEQSPLLPAGVVGRTKRDEDVICWKAGQRIRKREHRIVGPNYSACVGSQLLKLTENRLKSLIGLLARFVGGGSQPFKPRCKSGGNDDDLVSCVNEFTDTERQLLRSACRLSGRHQESRRHSATS